jgi:thioredoxin reductase
MVGSTPVKILELNLSRNVTDTVIIGAGPYGLSLAAHLRAAGRSLRIFGAPMDFWSSHMPRGMRLKSEGFASDLYDSGGQFTLKEYCAGNNIPYRDIGLPVRLDTFIAYGLEFQRRYVPDLENVRVVSLSRSEAAFSINTSSGEALSARRVVVAAGILYFAHVPPMLGQLPAEMVSHSSAHGDLGKFRGQRVAVLGAGASALDLAALLLEAGATVDLIARRSAIAFHDAPIEPRPFLQKLQSPRSGLGTGWRSRMCTDAPLVFHAMPRSFRFRVVERHLGPAPCWFIRDAVADRLPMHLGATITDAQPAHGRARLSFTQANLGETRIDVDHVVAATGYRVDLSRIPFINADLLQQVHSVEGTPVLSRQFESSVPGLFIIGAAAANSFGPLLRFAYGAKFAAKRVASRLARS